MRYEYISWNRFYRLSGVLYRRIAASGYVPDLIIAIARGGYPVARVLADYFDLMDLVSLKVEHYQGPTRLEQAKVPYPLPLSVSGRRVLLVDDVSDSGDSFDAASAQLSRHGEPAALRSAVLHHKQGSHYIPDFHAQRILKWRWITYPWAVVEDLTAIALRMTPTPTRVEELGQRLGDQTGLRLPPRVFAQIAPIVLQRVAEAQSQRR